MSVHSLRHPIVDHLLQFLQTRFLHRLNRLEMVNERLRGVHAHSFDVGEL